MSREHLFDSGKHEGWATFALKGVADIGNDQRPVAIPASLVLYAIGPFGLGFLTWWRRRTSLPVAT